MVLSSAEFSNSGVHSSRPSPRGASSVGRDGLIHAHAVERQPSELLSPAELLIMTEYAHHGSQKEAAACMGRAERTFKNYITGALAKLGVDTSLEAFKVLGWFRPPEHLR